MLGSFQVALLEVKLPSGRVTSKIEEFNNFSKSVSLLLPNVGITAGSKILNKTDSLYWVICCVFSRVGVIEGMECCLKNKVKASRFIRLVSREILCCIKL